MSDELRADEEGSSLAMPEPSAEVAAEGTFVAPAPPYESTAPEDAQAAGSDPGPPCTTRTGLDLTPALEAVAAFGAVFERRLDGLQMLFEREVRAEATREKVVDRLHAELQEYKQDLRLTVLRSVFIDLIQLHDDIGKMVTAQPPGEGEAGPEVRRLLDIMRGYQQGIEDILYRQGVEPYIQDGETFDPRRQRAVATVPTDDP